MRDVVMSRTVSEFDGTESFGRRLSRSVSTGSSAVRVGVGSPPIQAQRDKRLRTLADPDDEYGRRESHDVDEIGRARSSKRKQGQDYIHSHRSVDSSSADGEMSDSSVGAAGAKGASAGSNPNALKSIWKKTVNKLIGKMKAVETSEPEVKPAASAQNDAPTEVDPVYTFLKLTSVMPREGTTSVIPGEGHRCCPGSKTDRRLDDADVDETTYTHSNDPAKCQCPCHLPERLEACHYAWKKAFLINKT